MLQNERNSHFKPINTKFSRNPLEFKPFISIVIVMKTCTSQHDQTHAEIYTWVSSIRDFFTFCGRPVVARRKLGKTFCKLSNNTMALGGYKIYQKVSLLYRRSVSRRGGHCQEPGSRDDAVLVVLGVLSLSLALSARHRVVWNVRYSYTTVRSSRG